MAAEHVELVAVDADRIADDVAVPPDPAEIFAAFEADAAAGPDPLRHAIHRHDGAPGHHPGEARLAGAKVLRAYGRPYAVGADDDIGFGGAAVGKARDRRIVDGVGTDAVGAELQRRVAD